MAVLDANWMGHATRASARLYPHQWSWDSAFICVGLAHTAPERAWRDLHSLFAAQWPDGRVPHIVFDPLFSIVIAATAIVAITIFVFLSRRRFLGLNQILETMKSAVILVDMDGKIRVANRAATLLLGYPAEQLLGQSMRMIFDTDEDPSTRRILRFVGEGEPVNDSLVFITCHQSN